MARIDVSGLTLDDDRLAEIKDLLRYESSITFRSHRAAESMWLLVAEVERLRGPVLADATAEIDRLAGRTGEAPATVDGGTP